MYEKEYRKMILMDELLAYAREKHTKELQNRSTQIEPEDYPDYVLRELYWDEMRGGHSYGN